MPLLSHYIRLIRIQLVQEYLHGNVLDLGCGRQAIIYSLFKSRIENYYGVEHNKKVVNALQKEYPSAKFFAKDLDEDKLDFDIKFDCVLMTALIEHIFNQKHLMKQTISCLKDDGKIIVTTPTALGDIVHKIGSDLGLFYKKASENHLVIYNKKRFQTLANRLDLEICKYKLFELGCNQLVVLQKKNKINIEQ